MSSKIERLSSVTGTIVATASAATSPKIPFGAVAGGMLIVDAVSSATSLTWHVAFGPSDTPRPLQTEGADTTTTIVVDKAYALPDGLYAAPYIVAVANAGTATFRISVKG